MKRLGESMDGSKFVADVAKVPEITMAKAATYEQLLFCWGAIKKRLDSDLAKQVKEWGTLAFFLDNIYTSFSKPPYECDTGVKNIFENSDLCRQLKGLNIPEEFLLHSVRIGAIKGIQNRLEKSPHDPVELRTDGTMARLVSEQALDGRLDDPEAERRRLLDVITVLQYTPTIDGLSWANEQLKILAQSKKKIEEESRQEKARGIDTSKSETIARIQKEMHKTGFRFAPNEASLLKSDFNNKLGLWKAVLEQGLGRVLKPFFEKHGSDEISKKIFDEFVALCDTNSEIQKILRRNSLPLEIINPDSGWFSVLIINKKTKLKDFVDAVYGNMNLWFDL